MDSCMPGEEGFAGAGEGRRQVAWLLFVCEHARLRVVEMWSMIWQLQLLWVGMRL